MQVRPLSILIIVLFIAGCPGPQPRPVDDVADPLAAAERLVADGREAQAAVLLERAADRRSGVQASRLRVRAAAIRLSLGELDAARAQMARVVFDLLDGDDELQAMLVYAALAVDDGRPGDALSRLPPVTADLSDERAAEVYRIRAAAQRALGNHREAVSDLVRRDALLDSRTELLANQEAIWRALRQVGPEDEAVPDPVLAGWLALSGLRQIAWQDPTGFQRALRDWRAAYPGHPATERFLPRLVEEQRRVATGVSEIAVILPLTGRFAAAAAAVRDGLLAAHYQGADVSRRPRVMFYDDAGNPDIAVERYREAVQDGADFVIGPLQRESVMALAGLAELPVPVLALNTIESGPVPGGLYQFGLVPEEEAIQIAERIYGEGHERGLVLVPDSDLGIRMFNAFRTHFESLGGTLLATELYNPAESDHSSHIIRTLAIDESRARQQTLRSVLNVNLQVEPRRRQDAEFIFLVATPQQGRALRPQLRFHHASGIPVYASSHLFTGVINRAQDNDMNGIAFTDMPWTISPDTTAGGAHTRLREHLGGIVDRNPRFYALGFDAYRLAPVLRHDPTLLTEPVPAATGALRVANDGRVHRTLSWAQFRGGIPRPMRILQVVDPDEDGP